MKVGETTLLKFFDSYIPCRIEKLTPAKRIANIFFLKPCKLFTIRRMRVETKYLFVRYRK